MPEMDLTTTISSLLPLASSLEVDPSSVPPAAVLEIAEGSRSPMEVLGSRGYTEAQVEWLMEHRPFVMQIDRMRADLQKDGYTFRSKAALLAETHLETVHVLAGNPEVSPSVRLDIVKWLAKVGNLEPKPDMQAMQQPVSITINLSEGAAPMTIVSDSVQ